MIACRERRNKEAIEETSIDFKVIVWFFVQFKKKSNFVEEIVC